MNVWISSFIRAYFAASQNLVRRSTRTNSHSCPIIRRQKSGKSGNLCGKDSKCKAAISQDTRPSEAVGYDPSCACVNACVHTQTPITSHAHTYSQRICKIREMCRPS